MTVTSNSDFAKRMMLLTRPATQFTPTAVYDPDSDCIEFLYRPDPFYAERVDDLVTVYYSQETGEVVGSLLKGVRKFCKDMLAAMPGFKVEIHDGPVCLRHIFLARLWSSTKQDPDGLVTLTYRKLIEVSEDTHIDGELCVA